MWKPRKAAVKRMHFPNRNGLKDGEHCGLLRTLVYPSSVWIVFMDSPENLIPSTVTIFTGNYSEFIYIIYNSLKSWELSTHAFQHVFTQWIQSTYIVSGTPAAARKIRRPESSSGCMFPAGMASTGIYSSSLGYHQLRKLTEWFPEEVPVRLVCPVAGGQNIHAVAPAKCSAL